MTRAGIIGGATTNFGELWDRSPRSLAKEAYIEALATAGLKPSKIEAVFVGNMLSGILGGQEHLGAFFADELGMRVPAFKIEGACASGGLTFHNGVNSILAGQYRAVLVLGVEKMTDFKPEEIAVALMGAGSEEERLSGVTFPGLYAIIARAHMYQYKTTEEDMAAVAVKNHYHASLNGKAQFKNIISIGQVLASSKIADPLKLLDCSPISDGAAAVVLVNEDFIKERKLAKPVWVKASVVATDSLGLSGRQELTSLQATVVAAKKAYQQADLCPKDIDVAEVHDCFTIAEILAMEDLGFYEKGKAARAIVRGETTLGKGKLAVNTSGGLKACGHPVGATGVKQIVEIFHQLRHEAGKKQVERARVGLAHNVGGSGATVVVHILTS